MIDPYQELAEHNRDGCQGCAIEQREVGAVEPLRTLLTDVELLAKLPPEPGHWANPASLSRFDSQEMNYRQFRSFEAKVKPTMIDWHTPCWLWTGGTHEKGYGRFYLGLVDNKRIHAYAHRISFEHWIGMPPRGYIVDHQCNHKLCCNPTHLWPETSGNNTRLANERRPWKRRNQYSKE